MAVEQEHAQLWPRIENRVDQHGDAARLANAGRTEDGEVLAEQVVDVDGRVNRLVVMQRPDVDRPRPGGAIDEPELVGADDARAVANRRIGRDAANEALDPVVLLDLTHQIDPRDRAETRVAAVGVAVDLRHHANQAIGPRGDGEECADGCAQEVAESRRRQADARFRPLHANHSAQRRLDRR